MYSNVCTNKYHSIFVSENLSKSTKVAIKTFELSRINSRSQDCQMVYFHTKKHNLGKFWRALKWKRLVFLRPLGIYKCHLVYFMAYRYYVMYRVRQENAEFFLKTLQVSFLLHIKVVNKSIFN
jgi:hypothetical protein